MKSVKECNRACDICQKNKRIHLFRQDYYLHYQFQKLCGRDISMDFVEGLPKWEGKNAIFEVVYRLSKFARFLPLVHPYTAEQVTKLFFKNIYKLRGLSRSIVCDRDPIFISKFC